MRYGSDPQPTALRILWETMEGDRARLRMAIGTVHAVTSGRPDSLFTIMTHTIQKNDERYIKRPVNEPGKK